MAKLSRYKLFIKLYAFIHSQIYFILFQISNTKIKITHRLHMKNKDLNSLKNMHMRYTSVTLCVQIAKAQRSLHLKKTLYQHKTLGIQ